MKKNNIYKCKLIENCAHNGEGLAKVCRPFTSHDFIGPLNFIDYAVLSPGISIGLHKHGNDEEVYFVIQGSGLMTVNGEQCDVKKGDLIINPPFGEHGIINNTDNDLHLLVIEVKGFKK